jgi:hypothetical protein
MPTGMPETRTDPSVFRTDCLFFFYFSSCIQVNRVTRPCTPFYGARQANGYPEAFPFHWKTSSTLSLASVTSRNSTASLPHAAARLPQYRLSADLRILIGSTPGRTTVYRDSRLFVAAEAVRKDLEGIDRGPICDCLEGLRQTMRNTSIQIVDTSKEIRTAHCPDTNKRHYRLNQIDR